MIGKIKTVVPPKKNIDYVWTCKYCGKEFKTKKLCDRHELMCTKHNFKDSITIKTSYFYVGGIIFILFLGWLFLKPSSTENYKYQPTPTNDPDPYMTCSWNKDKDGGETCPNKRMRKSECDDSICCYLGNGSYSSMSKVECVRLQAELDSKKPVYVRQPVQIQRPVNCTTNTIGNYTYTNCF